MALLLVSGLDLSEEDDGKGRQDRQFHKHLEQDGESITEMSKEHNQAKELSRKPDTFTSFRSAEPER